MKSKLEYLTSISLKRKIKTKWFLAANIILAVIIAGIINIDSIIKLFGGDFNEKTKIYIIDETEYTYDLLKTQIELTDQAIYGEESKSYEISKYDKDLETAKKEIEEDEKILVFNIKADEKNVIDVTLISDAYVETVDFQILQQAVNSTKTALAISMSNISEEEINKIYSSVEIERIILDESKKSEDENIETIMTTVFPIVILPFFMLTIFLVQMIGAEINDEKTTRGMEIIISNVSPKAHFFSKVLAGNIFVILQGALLIIYFLLGLSIRYIVGSGNIDTGIVAEVSGILSSALSTDFISKLVYIIPITLVLMIVTFLAYSLLAGILASMTTNAEDFNQLQTPIMIISLIGYYLAMMAGVFKGAIFIRILSYVPFISAILAPSLLVLGQIGIIDIIISIVIVILTNYLLIKYGLKIYKVGILNYSSKDLWKKMFKALKD